jgi:hypothetical protein
MNEPLMNLSTENIGPESGSEQVPLQTVTKLNIDLSAKGRAS